MVLLERLCLRQSQFLAFLDNLTIPRDNNQAERALCLLQAQQKVSGCVRVGAGAEAFARLPTYLSTIWNQGVALLDALRTLFTGSSLYSARG